MRIGWFQIHVRSAFWIAPLATEQVKPTDDVGIMSFTNHPMRVRISGILPSNAIKLVAAAAVKKIYSDR
jgi:hypothetical protein